MVVFLPFGSYVQRDSDCSRKVKRSATMTIPISKPVKTLGTKFIRARHRKVDRFVHS